MFFATKQEPGALEDSRAHSDSPPRESTYARAACTECSRRKQKCNREWPCQHCKKRKIADQCRFNHESPASRLPPATPAPDVKRKRDHSEDGNEFEEVADGDTVSYGGESFEALGYSTAQLFAGLSTRDETTIRKPESKQYYKDAASCPQLARALQTLPPRPYTDSLVQNFLHHVNFHFYIVYPPTFLKEYQIWWRDRVEHKPLGLQWTCLLMMICACSTQYTDYDLERRLEEDLGEAVHGLTERFHNAARSLHSVIPVGHSHLLNVQQLLHSAYWYISEARFVECWHILSAAIREAQELGIHQESLAGPIPEFEREMRRRVWCVLDVWDWQISSLLGRPMIVDRGDCDIGQPSLSLEDHEPSPMLPLKLQSQLINQLAQTFGLPKYATLPQQVRLYQDIVDTWARNLPKWYSLENPDTSKDEDQPWIVMHRNYLHTTAGSMVLDPIRPYLTRDLSSQSSHEELRIRSDGIDYCLRLMETLHRFFEYVYPRDAKFHFIMFVIFDTASVLCSVIIHDQDNSAPRTEDMFKAIDGALGMLRRLSTVTQSAKTSYEVLSRIARRTKSLNQDASGTTTNHGVPTLVPQNSIESTTTPPVKQESPSAAPFPSVPPQKLVPYNTHGGITNAYVPMQNNYQPPPASQYYNMQATNGFHSDPSFMMPNTSYSMEAPSYSQGPQMPYASNTYGVMQPGFMPNVEDIAYAQDGAVHHGDRELPTGFPVITEEEMGQLAALWQYRSLNLDFLNPR